MYLEKTVHQPMYNANEKQCKSRVTYKRKGNQSKNVTAQWRRLKKSVFLLKEGLHHLPVRAQTKQIETQTVWSTDCSLGLKICWRDKQQVVVHVLIAQRCYPEAVGWLAAPGARARSREGLPAAPGTQRRGRFPLLTVSSHHNPNRDMGFSPQRSQESHC